jgi:DNA-binding MarR family transcriptional regulator
MLVYHNEVDKTGQMLDSAENAMRAAQTVPAAGCPEAVDDAHAATRMDVATGLVQLTSLVQGIYARVSERHDLTPVQAKLLCVLLEGPRGMADLAQCFGVEKAALTGLMDRAERRGLARRAAVPGDRRALQAILTDAGRQTATAFHAEVGTELSHLTETLPSAEREQFRATMAGIIQRCRAAHGAGRR